jgi:hypothetical protein
MAIDLLKIYCFSEDIFCRVRSKVAEIKNNSSAFSLTAITDNWSNVYEILYEGKF